MILNGKPHNDGLRPVNRFTRFYDFLANMGLVIRDDPPKVIDLKGREWGPEIEGLALSIRELPREEARQVTGISIVMRNVSAEPKRLHVAPLAVFYKVHGLELTPFGSQFLKSPPSGPNVDIALDQGQPAETELPLSTMFNLKALGEYRVSVTCTLPDGAEMASNEILIRV